MDTAEEADRELLPPELKILNQLLSVEFPGCEALREQLQGLKCRSIDSEGSLRLRTAFAPPAAVRRRIPVEGQYRDADDVLVHVLLHVIDGQLHELEIYKDDGTPIQVRPIAQALEITSLDAP